MQNKQTKLLFEGWRNFLNEEVGAQTDKPVPLNQIPATVAKAAYGSGLEDAKAEDDKVSGGAKIDVAVKDLHPMQKEVIPSKALGMAISYLLSGKPNLKDAEAIAAKDKDGKMYIMDGHHRWAALTLINPNETTKVTLVKGNSASDVVTALNVYTKAVGRTGNPGKGDIAQFASSIPAKINQFITNGTDDKERPIAAEKVKEALSKVPGANGNAEVGKQIIIKNAASLNTDKHPDAPDRINMPVVDGKEIEKVVSDLVSGKIDFKAPFSNKTTRAMGYQGNRNTGMKATDAFAKAKSEVKESKFDKLLTKIIREELNKLK